MSYAPPPYEQAGPPPPEFAHYGQPPPVYGQPPPAYGQPPPVYAQPPQQAYGAPQPAYYYQPAPAHPDEVRTVFVTGFPQDVKERELNNICRFLPGYEASQMHFRNDQAQGFALFATGALARASVDALNHLVFDDSVVLRAEMARKNMYMRDEAAATTAGPKRSRGAPGAPGFEGAPSGYGGPPPPGAPRGAAPGGPSTRDNPPCNTLFVGNLGEAASEAELHTIFSPQPGFQQLKLVRGPKGISCFIEFADVPTAMACHSTQQGSVLQSSDRGGIRIQFSKNPFGRKRDAYGNQLEQPPPEQQQQHLGSDPNAGGYHAQSIADGG